MNGCAADLTVPQQALAAYIEGLLGDGPADAHAAPPASAGDRPLPGADGTAPADGAGPFDTLLFDAAGLRLAVPADRILRVMALPKGPPLDTGVRTAVHQRPEGELRICHTAAWVLPADRAAAAPPPRRLLVVRHTSWALSCSTIVGMLTLSPSEVRWRTDAGRRPWLAGMLSAHACALLDIEALLRLAAATPP